MTQYGGKRVGKTLASEVLLNRVFFEGPWEHLARLALGIRKDATLRWDIPDGAAGWRAVLGWLGDYCDERDSAWHRRHVRRGTKPLDIWKRRTGTTWLT